MRCKTQQNNVLRAKKVAILFSEAQIVSAHFFATQQFSPACFPLPHVDTMLLISDCSRRGVQAVGRIAEMIREMDLKPGEMKLIVNRAPNGVLNPGVMEEINKYGLQLAGVLPQDETVYEYDCEGKPSSQVPDDTPVKKALAAVMRDLKL